MADPGFDARLNVVGTVNALEAASRADASRFVFTSTGGAIYGEGEERPDEVPFAESARCEPDSVYGQSKLAAEGYVDLYGRIRGLSAATLRLGNVYGPRQDPATEAGVVAIFCGVARDGGRPTVFGTGKQTRDYVYVDDVVAGIIACEKSEDDRARSTWARVSRRTCSSWSTGSVPLLGPRRLPAAVRPASQRRDRANGARRLAGGAGSRVQGAGARCRPAWSGQPRPEAEPRLISAPCRHRPSKARSASASSTAGSATRPACGTCWRPLYIWRA